MSLSLSQDASSGRYLPLGGDELLEPLITHRPQDEVSVRWEGHEGAMGWAPLSSGAFALTSPPNLSPLSGALVQPVLEQFAGRWTSEAPPTLRWVGEGVEAAPQALPADELSLYVGGSRSLAQRGAYREIHHFQLALTLADDGLFELPSPLALSRPGSSLWVYLERRQRAWQSAQQHSVSASVGRRVELRESGASEPPPSLSSPVRLRGEGGALNEAGAHEALTRGLLLAWTPVEGEGAEPVERFTLLLTLRGGLRLEQLSCEVSAEARALWLSPELLSFWPTSADALRQLTLRAQLKERRLEGADRGALSEGVSLIVQLAE